MSNKNLLLPIKTPVKIGFLSFLGDQGGCSCLRIQNPYILLRYLNIPKVSIHTTYLSQWINDVNFFKSFSFVQFQRSATEAHLNMHRMFRSRIQTQHKIPLIYEIDDLLGSEIPEWNFAHSYYKDNIYNVESMMRESNAVVVSTEPLKKYYSKYNKNIEVIPNHLPKFIWGEAIPKHNTYNTKPRILWAGSQNHFTHKSMNSSPQGGDFGSMLLDFIKKTVNDYSWIFMGALPMELEDVRDKLEFHPWRNTWQYPKYVKALNADIGIAPLQNIFFNICKSRIKALEFTAMGIPGIYSNVYPYKDMTIKCDTEEYMIDRIETLAKDTNLRMKVWNKDYETLKDELWWEESDNLKRYVNTYLKMMGRKLPE